MRPNLFLLPLCLYCSSLLAQEMKLTAFDGGFADLFGFDVAIDGDHAVVGAPLQDGFGTFQAGAAYVFQRINGTWTYVKKLTPPWNGDRGDQYGYSVDISGNYIAIGAYKDDHNGLTDVGGVYVYSGSGSSWGHIGTLYPSDGQSGDHFGNSVGISGRTVIVGAAQKSDLGQQNRRSLYL